MIVPSGSTTSSPSTCSATPPKTDEPKPAPFTATFPARVATSEDPG